MNRVQVVGPLMSSTLTVKQRPVCCLIVKNVYSCYHVKVHILVVYCAHSGAPVCTLLIQVMIASSVSYGSSWVCPSEEYLLMQDMTLSTLTISTVYAIISVSMSAKWELCRDIQQC